ncbi:sigma 54-interacting transcriptional regulator, partial [Staphylococcus sp. SIMBA_130]
VNCGAIPQDLIESELFGYEGGAFTGANRNGKPGMFEMADNGVLFLDEVGELPLKTQVKLLQVIQDNTIQRIGATKLKKVNVRIIAA